MKFVEGEPDISRLLLKHPVSQEVDQPVNGWRQIPADIASSVGANL